MIHILRLNLEGPKNTCQYEYAVLVVAGEELFTFNF